MASRPTVFVPSRFPESGALGKGVRRLWSRRRDIPGTEMMAHIHRLTGENVVVKISRFY